MLNRVKQLREKLNISQQKLAELVNTSQQQIQRIESGSIATRIELATNLSVALGKPLNAVFPGIKKLLLPCKMKLKLDFCQR